MLSQAMRILQDLNRGRVIDHLTAFRDYDSWALRSRIPEVNKILARYGRPRVSTRWVSKNGKCYKQYFIPASQRK